MKKVIENIIAEVEKFNDSIREALDSKKITNTGEAAKSLRIEFGVDSIKSVGIFYLEYLDTGRYPGALPPFAPISKWVATKLGITDEKANTAVTWKVMKKIQALGTEIAINNRNGIELDKKISKLREDLNPAIAEGVVLEVKQLLDVYKTIWKNKINNQI